MTIDKLIEHFNTTLFGDRLYVGGETIAISNTFNGIYKEKLLVTKDDEKREICVKVDKENGGKLTFNDLIEKLKRQPYQVKKYTLKFCFLGNDFEAQEIYAYTYKGENIVTLSQSNNDLRGPSLGAEGERELDDSQLLSTDDMLY